jgi:hypothetical protein
MTIKFTRDLIKGRIAEVIFEQMIREEGKYTIIPFGYEYTVPTLSQYQHLTEIKRVMDNIKDAPDFALVSNDKRKVYLVEVKFRKELDPEELKDIARKLLNRWNPSWLFVATPDRFYCAPCSTIVRDGKISPLSISWITHEHQMEYLRLLNEFECR